MELSKEELGRRSSHDGTNESAALWRSFNKRSLRSLGLGGGSSEMDAGAARQMRGLIHPDDTEQNSDKEGVVITA